MPLRPPSVTQQSYTNAIFTQFKIKISQKTPRVPYTSTAVRVLYTRLIVSILRAYIGGSMTEGEKPFPCSLLINRFQTGIRRPFCERVHSHNTHTITSGQVDNDVKRRNRDVSVMLSKHIIYYTLYTSAYYAIYYFKNILINEFTINIVVCI